MIKVIQIRGKSVFFMGVALTLFFGFSEHASAAAWWGDGYRDPAWVIAHGGTIINYTIIGANSTKKYKAMMFRGGEYVEVEFGSNQTFDDAKNGTYVINFYKCKSSCMDHKYDKKTKIRSSDKLIASVAVVARPGETNNVVFDAAGKRAYLAGRSGYAAPVDPFVAQKKAAEEQEGGYHEYALVHDKSYRFDQLTYLAPNVDFTAFAQVNIDAGIIPRFAIAQEVVEEVLEEQKI